MIHWSFGLSNRHRHWCRPHLLIRKQKIFWLYSCPPVDKNEQLVPIPSCILWVLHNRLAGLSVHLLITEILMFIIVSDFKAIGIVDRVANHRVFRFLILLIREIWNPRKRHPVPYVAYTIFIIYLIRLHFIRIVCLLKRIFFFILGLNHITPNSRSKFVLNKNIYWYISTQCF